VAVSGQNSCGKIGNLYVIAYVVTCTAEKTGIIILQAIKLNTFANFKRPSKIDLSELFFGRLKDYVDFFCHFLLSVIIQ
jgi:hypothetical protein